MPAYGHCTACWKALQQALVNMSNELQAVLCLSNPKVGVDNVPLEVTAMMLLLGGAFGLMRG